MSSSRFIFGIIIVAVGLSIFTGFPLLQFAIAIGIILIGVKVMTGGREWSYPHESSADVLNEVVILGPLNRKVTSAHFRGGRIVAILGGGEVDLRNATMEGAEIPLEITAILGGIKLIVPTQWGVVPRGTAILGGFNNQAKPGDGGTLEIAGAAILGGVDITN